MYRMLVLILGWSINFAILSGRALRKRGPETVELNFSQNPTNFSLQAATLPRSNIHKARQWITKAFVAVSHLRRIYRTSSIATRLRSDLCRP